MRPKERARLAIPVPASMTVSGSPGTSTLRHDVFPPYRMVCGPGTGSEPSVPQIVTDIIDSPPCSEGSKSDGVYSGWQHRPIRLHMREHLAGDVATPRVLPF